MKDPFVVKWYGDDPGPTIKGNGFDGLRLGNDREEAQGFVDAINAELTRLRAELAKRERQIVWALRHGADYRANFLTWYLAPDEGNDNRTEIVMDDSDSGLLAAVDEAMGEK